MEAGMDDFLEPCCCFDSSQYTGIPDTAPVDDPISVPDVIAGLDRLNSSGRESEGRSYLEQWLEQARKCGDWRAELSFLNELLGQYRRTGSRDEGIKAVNAVMDILRCHHMGSTLSGATILLNAATTMKCFGLAGDSIPVFTHSARVFASHLDPADYRFAGLYNNMALSYEDTGDFSSAERYFRLALSVLEQCPGTENDRAVTFCNMAEMYYAQDPEDPRIDSCMENAWRCLNEPGLAFDGYHAFTISKCAPTFDLFGYFLYSEELKKRSEDIYAGS